MIKSIIVPLVKNRSKYGNLSDKTIVIGQLHYLAYHQKSLNIILFRLEDYLWINDNQFGFKPSHSTDLCVYALMLLCIEYFKSRSTSIYVEHSLTRAKPLTKLVIRHFFLKMIDRNVPIYLVKILCYWYQHQEMIVQWGSSLSNVFFVTNGVRQGGIL